MGNFYCYKSKPIATQTSSGRLLKRLIKQWNNQEQLLIMTLASKCDPFPLIDLPIHL